MAQITDKETNRVSVKIDQHLRGVLKDIKREREKETGVEPDYGDLIEIAVNEWLQKGKPIPTPIRAEIESDEQEYVDLVLRLLRADQKDGTVRLARKMIDDIKSVL